MSENPYLRDTTVDHSIVAMQEGHADARPNDAFYVVSRKKFFILFITTFGLYKFYWFYRNWAQYKKQPDSDDVWPIPRALFQIFFIHSLFSAVDRLLIRQGKRFDWNARSHANRYVGLMVVNYVLGRMAGMKMGAPISSILYLLLVPVMALVLSVAQMAINEACDDPEANSNKELTAGNYAWILVGAIIWIPILVGTFF